MRVPAGQPESTFVYLDACLCSRASWPHLNRQASIKAGRAARHGRHARRPGRPRWPAGGAVSQAALWRRLLAELLGSAFLAAIVIGSGYRRAAAVARRHRAGAAGERRGYRGRAVRDHPDVRPGIRRALQPGRVVRRRRVRRAALARRRGLPARPGRRLHRRGRGGEPDVRLRRGQHLGQGPGHARALPVRGHRHARADRW